MALRLIDTSDELQVHRFGHGIKLATVEEARHATSRPLQQTLGGLMKLPLSVYLISADSINQRVNEDDAELCGFDSTHDAMGKACHSKFTQESITNTSTNDRVVMQSQQLKISEEEVILTEANIYRPTLSFKMPWYNSDNEVIGLFGFSVIIGRHSLANSLSLLNNLGILTSIQHPAASFGNEVDGVYLSKRQKECAILLLNGLSLKEIAERLKLSPRTIETYIQLMKNKLNCRNKTELAIKLSAFYRS